MPCRKVRRGRCFLVMNDMMDSAPVGRSKDPQLRGDCLRRHSHLKRRTLHDAQDQVREPIAVLRRVAHDACAPPACRSSCVSRPTPYISSFSVITATNTSERASSAFRSAAGAVDRRAVHELCPRRRSSRPRPSVRQRPMASKFSSASPMGSMILWQPAQAGFARCCSMRSRTDLARRGRLLVERRHVGRRRRRRAAQQVLENPLAADDRRRAVRVRGDEQQAALSQQAPARVARHRHAAEVGP